MFVCSVLRTLFITCVPLFLLLTGWLHQGPIKINACYYYKLFKILFLYVLCGLVCQIFSCLFLHDAHTVSAVILSFFEFTAAPYGWYIAMYVGLYLLIPFLNMIWDKSGPVEKQALLLSLLVLTVLPSIADNFNFGQSFWWIARKDKYDALLPDFWTGIYPITYYFLGIYLKENEARLVSRVRLFQLLLAMLLFGTVNYIKNYNGVFPWNYDTSYGGYQCMIISILTVGVCLRYRLKGEGLNRLVCTVSRYSLGMYLVSFIFDRIVYHVINTWIQSYGIKTALIPATVSAVACGSLALSLFLTGIVNYLFMRKQAK